MGIFTGIKGAKRGFSSNPIKEGDYVVRIDDAKVLNTRMSGELWKTTLTVLAVESGENKVGEVVHVFFGTKHGLDIFQQNVKSLLAGVLDCADEDIDDAAAERCILDDSPIVGLVTRVRATRRTSQKTVTKEGLPATYLTYSWSAALTNEEIERAITAEGVKRFFPNGL